nr:receptor-type tyrosine-protein phosphatase H-like isoform X2 [Procambarus clarkii]
MRVFVILAAIVAASAADLGYVENFKQTASGDGTITLEWDYVSGDENFPIQKYSLESDDSINTVGCVASHCSYTYSYLQACKEYTFDLTPIFVDTVNGGTVNGDKVTTTGFANDNPPSAASNLSIAGEDDTGTTLQWDAPDANPDCVKYYEVCARLDGQSDTECHDVYDTSVKLASLQACGYYHVKVTPVTPTDARGPELDDTVTTMDGTPGPPEDVVVGLVTNTTVDLKWNDPAVNPLCAVDYSITYGPVTTRASRIFSLSEETYDHHATLSPLEGCTNYSISISSVSKSDLESVAVTRYAATKETEPLPAPYIVVDPADTDAINVHWGEDENDNCAGYFIICWNDGIHAVDTCENVTDSAGFTITDLLPCTEYAVTITVVSPGGIRSVVVGNSTSTLDVRPEPVKNLQVTEVYKSTISITFEPPETNKQCIKGYAMLVTDLNTTSVTSRTMSEMRTSEPIEEFITNLEPCTNYRIMMAAVSPTGLMSPPQETYTRTTDDIPSEPQQFGLNGVTTSSISLQWYQPETNSRCASQYVLTWKDSAGTTVGNETIVDPSSFKVSYTVEGLNPCETYTFSLIAKSPAGESNAAEFSLQTLCS